MTIFALTKNFDIEDKFLHFSFSFFFCKSIDFSIHLFSLFLSVYLSFFFFSLLFPSSFLPFLIFLSCSPFSPFSRVLRDCFFPVFPSAFLPSLIFLPFWAAAPKGSMTYAFTHMGSFLLLLPHPAPQIRASRP